MSSLSEWPKYWLSNIEPPEIIPGLDDIPILSFNERIKLIRNGHPFFEAAIVFVQIPGSDALVPLYKPDAGRKESEFKYKIKYTWKSA